MKKSIVAFLLMITLFSCKKEAPKQYSTWYVNGQKFSTNDVRIDEGKAIHIMSTKNLFTGFEITFHLDRFPTSGIFHLDCYSQNPNHACLGILHSDTAYFGNPSHFLSASFINGKARYTVSESWFYNSYRPEEDSILVKGVFNEP